MYRGFSIEDISFDNMDCLAEEFDAQFSKPAIHKNLKK